MDEPDAVLTRTVSSRGPTDDEEWDNEFFVPPPIDKPGEFPNWLIEKAGELVSLDGVITELGDDWLDHWGTATYAGKEWLVSEPYTLSGRALRQLLSFAERLGLGVSVQASGAHRPGQTMRVMLRLKGDYEEGFLQEHEGYHPNRPRRESGPIRAGNFEVHSMSEVQLDTALCASISKGDLFAFVDTETEGSDLIIVANSRLEEFKRDHPSAQDVSKSFIRRHSQ
jgi:hypothetical protein